MQNIYSAVHKYNTKIFEIVSPHIRGKNNLFTYDIQNHRSKIKSRNYLKRDI